MSETPTIQVATLEHKEGKVNLSLVDAAGTTAKFHLEPVALALLAVTVGPTTKLALADLKAAAPEMDKRFPDDASEIDG